MVRWMGYKKEARKASDFRRAMRVYKRVHPWYFVLNYKDYIHYLTQEIVSSKLEHAEYVNIPLNFTLRIHNSLA